MLGTDVQDLIATIYHNLTCEPKDAFYQRTSIYDNIPVERLSKLLEKLRKRAQATLDRDGHNLIHH